MTRFVLDSSVAIAWFFPEGEKERLYAACVLRMIIESGAKVYVPPLFHIEFGEFLLRRRRTKEAKFSQARLNSAINDMDALGISTVISQVSYREIIQYGIDYHMQGKDVPFLHLAKEQELPLASLDGGQIQAAKQNGVEVVAFN